MEDPMEKLIRDALIATRTEFTESDTPAGVINKGLDFHLTDFDIHIEVKQFHTPRIAEQMSRAPNVIAVQGRAAVEFMAEALRQAL